MRKSILLLILSFMMQQLSAQTIKARLHGIIKDARVKSIELTIPADAALSKWVDTKVAVVNGAFDTSIQLPFPAQIWITYGLIGNRNSFISGDAGILIENDGKLQIKGSPMQDEYENEFLPFFGANDRAFDSMQSFYQRSYEVYGRDYPN
jgi:hypothetical protein